MGLTVGVASGNSTMTAIGLTMVAIPALISGGMAIAAGIGGAALTGIVGGVTFGAGIGSGLFASAEYQVSDGDKTKLPKPGEIPRHPYGQIGLQWMLPNTLDYFMSRNCKKVDWMFTK